MAGASGLVGLTIAEMRDGLGKREFSGVDLAQAHIEAAEAARPLNAYITETARTALDRAFFPTRAAPRAPSVPCRAFPSRSRTCSVPATC